MCFLFICACTADVVSTLGVLAACFSLIAAHCFWKALYELLGECVSFLSVCNMCSYTRQTWFTDPQGRELKSQDFVLKLQQVFS